MKLKKTFHIGGLSWAKVLSIALLFVVLLYPNGMTGKALIQEESNPLGIDDHRGCLSDSGDGTRPGTPEIRTITYISPLASGAENPNHSGRPAAGRPGFGYRGRGFPP